MQNRRLEADCSQCAALCCVAFAFDRVQGFPLDKPNGVPCPNLSPEDRCRIHSDREAAGFGPCVTYDCAGAGQRLTQEVFFGRSWRDDPALLPRMIRAFVTLSRVHELLSLLEQTDTLPLSAGERGMILRMKRKLDPDSAWTEEALCELPIEALSADVHASLRQLHHHLSGTASQTAAPQREAHEHPQRNGPEGSLLHT